MSELREALEEAVEDAEPEEEVQAVEDTASVEPVSEPEPAEGDTDKAPKAETTEGETTEEQQPAPTAETKAPVDWSADLRESWGKLPEAVRGKILDREAQMEQTMRGTAEARRAHQALGQIQQQYGTIIATEGASNPIQAVQQLLQTTTELRMGTPAQKAQRMAELINHFGVDIQALDNVLVGQPAQDPQYSQMEQLIEQRMAPVNQMMNQFNNMQQGNLAHTQQQIEQEVTEFQKNTEFLNDVRNDMADLIDMSTRQGREMPLQEAYDKACAMRPEIQGVISQRAEAAKLTQQKQSMASKRNAASSVVGSGGGTGDGKPPQSLHAQLNSIWDDLAG